MDQRAWKLCGQCSALGLLLFLSLSWSCLQRLKLGFNRRYIGIDQVIKQAGLLRTQLFAALGKLESLELRDLVGQLLDHCSVATDLLAHRFNRLAQRADLMVERLDTLHQLRR